MTSILVYLNEIALVKDKELDSSKMSHLANPGKAIVDFINAEMGDPDAEQEKWRDFPRIVLKAITANTYFFTRMMEMCQKKQLRDDFRNLQVLSQIIYQVAKIGVQRKWRKEENKVEFYSKEKEIASKSRYSVMLMAQHKFDMLKKVQDNFKKDETKLFAIPGMLASNVAMEEAFRNFSSPLESKGNFVKVMFKIEYDWGRPDCT